MPSKWIPQPFYLDAGTGEAEVELTEVHSSHVESHNILSGNPSYRVRLACPWEKYSKAVSELLGRPQRWPHPTIFDNVNDIASVRAASIELVNDQGDATKDANGETLDYKYFALFDVLYLPRKGRYIPGTGESEARGVVYWEDEVQQRYSSFPMDNTKLIWATLAGGIPAEALRLPLHSNEAPVKFESGETLVHTIEGWILPVSEVAVVGTVNQNDYVSAILNKTFLAGTLLLRSIHITVAFSFRSYRPIENPDSPDPLDPSGKPTLTLKLSYEYRKEGWNKFWRNSIDPSETGYYKILKNGDPFGEVIPFHPVDHGIYLDL